MKKVSIDDEAIQMPIDFRTKDETQKSDCSEEGLDTNHPIFEAFVLANVLLKHISTTGEPATDYIRTMQELFLYGLLLYTGTLQNIPPEEKTVQSICDFLAEHDAITGSQIISSSLPAGYALLVHRFFEEASPNMKGNVWASVSCMLNTKQAAPDEEYLEAQECIDWFLGTMADRLNITKTYCKGE